MTSTVGAFAQRKAQTLAELSADSGDFSRAGHVDERARPIVGLVNRHPSFFTTSSCAGRVSLFADPTTATRAAGMKGGEWVYVNHDPAYPHAIAAAVRRKLGEDEDGGEGTDPECTLVLRFEPFILSVEASTLEEGAGWWQPHETPATARAASPHRTRGSSWRSGAPSAWRCPWYHAGRGS